MSGTNTTAISYFKFSCPKGGNFHICVGSEVEFMGCCTSDPCVNGGICPDSELRYSTFDKTKYSLLTRQTCNTANTTANWYTCTGTSPAFMGCCSSNPCAGDGCPQADLLPAKLSSANRNDVLSPSGVSTTASSATATATASSSASATSTPSSGLSTGAVAGIAVGATAVGLLLIGFLIWKCWLVPRNKKAKEAEKAQTGTQEQHAFPPMTQPGSPGTFVTQQTPMSHYQSSFVSTPTTAVQYPSGVPTEYGKLSPHQQNFDRPLSMSTYSDVSSVNPRAFSQGYNQGYSPVPMIPVQEMDGTEVAPQELSTGQEHNLSQNASHAQHVNQDSLPSPQIPPPLSPQTPQNQQGPPRNHLGISP